MIAHRRPARRSNGFHHGWKFLSDTHGRANIISGEPRSTAEILAMRLDCERMGAYLSQRRWAYPQYDGVHGA
jgi:hypothetical protein